MPLDNFIAVPGRGTVVIGTVKRGQVKKGESLQVIGFGADIKINVAAMQVFKKNVDLVVAGDNVGLNVKQVKTNQLKKGMVLVKPGSFKPTNHFDVSFLSFAQ